jgi:hypothetical protein
MSDFYEPDYYGSFQGGSVQSPRAAVPLVIDLIRPRSVVDLNRQMESFVPRNSRRYHLIAVLLRDSNCRDAACGVQIMDSTSGVGKGRRKQRPQPISHISSVV